ncbi:MAG: nitroreductase family protein [Candidatus Bathyarchaeia archaeon]
MEFLEVVKRRRSVRRYKPEPVPRETLEQVLESARLAPSWGNNQCWRFIVVDDSQLKARLAECGSRWIRDVPVLVVACADPTMSMIKGDQFFYLSDVAVALEHMALAATEKGLGNCLFGSFDEAAVRRVLQIPDHVRTPLMLALGIPAEEPEAKPRKRLDEIVSFNRYGWTL